MKLAFNFAIYCCGWWTALLGGNATALIALFLILLTHFALWRDLRDIFVILGFIFLGFALEWLFMVSRVLDYGSSLPPAWAICQWAMLATTLRYSLSVLAGWPLRAFLVGAISAPVVYANSVYYGPVEWARASWEAMLILAACCGPLVAVTSGMLLPFLDRLDGGTALGTNPAGPD